MNAIEVVDIVQEAIYLLIKISMPVMLVALGVGLIISLFQALTQIQEQTLTFVPKVMAIFLTIMFTLPWMIDNLTDFTHDLRDRIITIEERDNDVAN